MAESDALLPDAVGDANILSTNAENWEAVARELIVAASAIVLLIGDLSPGVASEIELIRELGRVEQTLVTIVEAHHTPTLERGDAERLRSSLADFHQMDPGADPGAVAKLLRGARTRAPAGAGD